MIMQMELFKPKTMEDAKQERDVAMQSVEMNADERWKMYCIEKVKLLADTMETFTSDDLMDAIIKDGNLPHDNRAIGPVMRKASRLHLIEPCKWFVPSRRRHMAHICMWKKFGKKI